MLEILDSVYTHIGLQTFKISAILFCIPGLKNIANYATHVHTINFQHYKELVSLY